VVGVVLIFLVGERLVKRKESLLAQNGDVAWSTPWNGETVWQVLSWAFPNGTNPSTASVFVAQLKPSGSGTDSGVVQGYLLLRWVHWGAVFIYQVLCHCQKVGFVSTRSNWFCGGWVAVCGAATGGCGVAN